jgi:hypothetical protein
MLNVAYRIMLCVIVLVLAWNTLKLKEPRKQLMSALLIIPFVLRVIGVK